MVEGILVDRGLERMKRSYQCLNQGTTMELKLWPWPYACGVIFSFDCEGTYGGGKTFEGETEVVPQLAKFLKKNNLNGTFNFVGKIADEFSDVVKYVLDLGHDIGGHGYTHTFLDGLSKDEQMKEIEKTIESIENACNYRIKGWRTPYLTYNKNTYDLLEKLNFSWDSSWSRSLWGKSPFNPVLEEKMYNLVEIPTDDIHYDTGLYRWDSPPAEVKHLWINHLKVTRMEHSLYVFLNHPVNMANNEERINAVRELIKQTKTFKNIWLTTCGDLARRFNLMKKVNFMMERIKRKKKELEVSLSIFNQNDIDMSDIQLLIKNIPRNSDICGIDSKKVAILYQNNSKKDVALSISPKKRSETPLDFVIEERK